MGGETKQTTPGARPCPFSSKFCISSLILHPSLFLLGTPPLLSGTSKSCLDPKYQQSAAVPSLLLKIPPIPCLQEMLCIKNKTQICAPVYTHTEGLGFRRIDWLEMCFSDFRSHTLPGASHIYFSSHIWRAAIWPAKVYVQAIFWYQSVQKWLSHWGTRPSSTKVLPHP